MKISLGSEDSAFQLKEEIKQHLISAGNEVIDVGQQSPEDAIMPYSVVGDKVAACILSGEAERGIVLCGTGAGVSIAANKHKGIYAVLCESVYTAKLAPIIVNANILALGARIVAQDMAFAMIDAFLSAGYLQDISGSEHQLLDGLFNKLQAMEKENF